MKKQVYKPYNQNQPMLIPLNLEEMIPGDHLVRQVDEIVNRIDTSVLDEQYEGGGVVCAGKSGTRTAGYAQVAERNGIR